MTTTTTAATADKKEAAPSLNKAANRANGDRFNNTPRRDFQPETLADIRGKLPQYLRALGIELKERSGKLVGKCPNSAHEDAHPSFAVLRDGKTCGCYPCSFLGDAFALSQWLGRSSDFPKAVREVAAVLGVYLPDDGQGQPQAATRPAIAPPRPAKQPEPPFILSDSDRAKVHAAKLAFSNAFHDGDEIIDRIAASLGLDRETLRLASWGSSGLGLSRGSYDKTVWLCYAYPMGLKWRNPDPLAKQKGKARFDWLIGKATAPWRMEWAAKPEVGTIYLTEGESDCLALIAAGIEADGTAACVALPGTSFPLQWAPLFTGKRVVLCFDHDKAGTAFTATVAGILKGHAAEILTWKGNRPQ